MQLLCTPLLLLRLLFLLLRCVVRLHLALPLLPLLLPVCARAAPLCLVSCCSAPGPPGGCLCWVELRLQQQDSRRQVTSLSAMLPSLLQVSVQ
jgi:hypothetical protein